MLNIWTGLRSLIPKALAKPKIRFLSRVRYKFLLSGLLCLSLTSCAAKPHTLKVAATSVPHAEILECIQEDLKAQGITLEILVIDDYQTPNRALQEKEIDANFFQHQPFLEDQKQQFHYKLIALEKIHIEPIGVYAKKIHSLDALKEGAVVAIPSDPTNEARALELLEQQGLIRLQDARLPSVLNIIENPRKLKIQEIDAPLLPRTLSEVDLAVIPANFALQAGLSPLKDALVLEDTLSPYVNLLVIREGEQTRADLQALQRALTTEKIHALILSKYQGALVPIH